MRLLGALCLGVALLATMANAQEQGIPDTVRIDGATLYVGQSLPVAVTVVNDYPVQSFCFPMIADMIDSGFAKLDSVAFVGRMADPQVLDMRITSYHDSNGVAPDSVIVAAFEGPACVELPPGSGPIYQLYMTGLTPGLMELDSAWFPPVQDFAMVPELPYPAIYTPQFVTSPILVVEGGLPPSLAVPEDGPHAAAGTEASFTVSAGSPEGYPVSIDLISFEPLEGGPGSPTQMPTMLSLIHI